MQKVSLRKLSLLGLVLMGASAVTAAVLPATKEDKTYAPGSLTLSTEGPGSATPRLTCQVDSDATIVDSCNITAGSGTSTALNSSDANGSSSTVGDVS